MNNLDWVSLRKEEGYGSLGSLGLEILCATDKNEVIKTKKVRHAIYEATDIIKAAVWEALLDADPNKEKNVQKNRELLDLFPETIFTKEIPNGYSDSWETKYEPWFLVTTKIGIFKIGWRRSVIHLEWTETLCPIKSIYLFRTEDVTKFDKVIHCHGQEAAKKYIDRIFVAASDETLVLKPKDLRISSQKKGFKDIDLTDFITAFGKYNEFSTKNFIFYTDGYYTKTLKDRWS